VHNAQFSKSTVKIYRSCSCNDMEHALTRSEHSTTARPPDSAPSMSACRHASVVSWGSAPARSTSPQCFLAKTAFRRPDGSLVRAAELRRSGDVLQGLGGSLVNVMDVQKHSPQERDYVTIRTHLSSFCITTEHIVLVEGPDGKPVGVQAQDVLRRCQLGKETKIYNGDSFHCIISADLKCSNMQVVDVLFEDANQAVLAWQFSGRRPRSVSCAAAVACLGRQIADIADLRCVFESRLSKDAPRTHSGIAGGRSRSEGAAANPQSRWSVGTCRDVAGPQLPRADRARCEPCETHRRYIKNLARRDTRPCLKGATCKYCHALPHDPCHRASVGWSVG